MSDVIVLTHPIGRSSSRLQVRTNGAEGSYPCGGSKKELQFAKLAVSSQVSNIEEMTEKIVDEEFRRPNFLYSKH
jgi:hypothetical protein